MTRPTTIQELMMTNRTSALGARVFEAFLLLLLLSVTLKLTGDLPWSWVVILALAWAPLLALLLGTAGWIGLTLLRRRPPMPASESASAVPPIMTVRQAFATRALTESLTVR
jgi:hypothetical protein